jgi:hypothetical protein
MKKSFTAAALLLAGSLAFGADDYSIGVGANDSGQWGIDVNVGSGGSAPRQETYRKCGDQGKHKGHYKKGKEGKEARKHREEMERERRKADEEYYREQRKHREEMEREERKR